MNNKQILDTITKFHSKTAVTRTSLVHNGLYLYPSKLMSVKPSHKCNSLTDKTAYTSFSR